jgi:hypothetical protein
VSCPVNEVLRVPYPRALVSEPVDFQLLPSQWSPSEGGRHGNEYNPTNLSDLIDEDGNPIGEGIHRKVLVWMRGERLVYQSQWPPFLPPGSRQTGTMDVPDIRWDFTGRSSAFENTQYGTSARFSYETASYVGPNAATGAVSNKGRRFDFNADIPTDSYDLPAYPASVQTYCGLWRKITGEKSERYWHRLTQCFPTYEDPQGNLVVPAGHSTEGCPTGSIAYGEWRYRWKPFTTEWVPMDMRDETGAPVSFIVMRWTTSGGVFKNQRWWEPTYGGLWVPAVEVQTVQTN